MIEKIGKIKNLVLVFILGVSIVLFFCLGINNDSYALLDDSNYMGDYVLNPDWVEYMDLSEEERASFEVIPDKFIHQYKQASSRMKFFSFRSTLPEYYNLNDHGLSTFPDNQGGLGICWAFGALSSVETNMLKTEMSNISDPVKFAPRQLDYISVHHDYIKEGINPYYVSGRIGPGSGAVLSTGLLLMTTGIGPVTEDIYGYFNERKDVKSIKETFNLGDVEYVVDSYVNYGNVGTYSSSAKRQAWVNEIKNHIMNYGSVLVGTIGPLPVYAGYCLYRDSNNNYMLNVKGDCNPVNPNNAHAMAIIGWDDNYEYEYCKLEDSTSNDLTGCKNIVSGKGAFILKNSWGSTYPYPYLAYDSNVNGTYGVTGVSVKNWDNNYDATKVYDYSYEQNISTITYYKSAKVKEKLKKISFYVNTKEEKVYDVFLSRDGEVEFTKIDSVITDKIGLVSINVRDIGLDSDKFTIKVTSENGYVDLIYAFTENVDEYDDVVIDTVIKSGYNYVVNTNSFEAYSVTKNVDNGAIIGYKLLDKSGKDVSRSLRIYNNFNLNDNVNLYIEMNDLFPEGKLDLVTYYDGKIYDRDEISVTKLNSLWTGGSGTVDDPYLITSVEDFKKIFTNEDYMSVYYKLVSDLDFSSISDWNVGELSGYKTFTGSFDGDGHVITGISGNTNLPSLFYSLEGAEVKNLIFSDMNWKVVDSGWGNMVAIMAYDSTLSNIRITKTVSISGSAKYAGGVIGTAHNSNFVNIANYADVSTNYSSNGKAAGIVVEAYGSKIEKSYNYGNITVGNGVAAGIVAYLGNYSSDIVGSVVNTYNFGYIKSDLIGSGIVGTGNATLVENSYNIFSKSVNVNKIANIVGTANGMVIRNSYYYSGYGKVIINDTNSTLVNVMGKTISQLKDKNTYLNFDFENIWTIDNEYPYLKDFYYFYLTNIVVDSKININLGETKLLEMSFIPSYANNKSVRYEVMDENIITVDDNGLIEAIGVGSTILKVISLDGSGVIKEINVTVGIDKINLSDYKVIEGKYIQIKENYNMDSFIESIYDGDSLDIKVVSPNDYIATGDVIGIYDKKGSKLFEYVAIVLGEITGDGVVDVVDVAKLYQYIRGTLDMGQEFKLAGNVVGDESLELTDVAKLYQYIRGRLESLEEKE